jgi:hypothetical protein
MADFQNPYRQALVETFPTQGSMQVATVTLATLRGYFLPLGLVAANAGYNGMTRNPLIAILWPLRVQYAMDLESIYAGIPAGNLQPLEFTRSLLTSLQPVVLPSTPAQLAILNGVQFGAAANFIRVDCSTLATGALLVCPTDILRPQFGYSFRSFADLLVVAIFRVVAVALNGAALNLQFEGYHGAGGNAAAFAIAAGGLTPTSIPLVGVRCPVTVLCPSQVLETTLAPMLEAARIARLPPVLPLLPAPPVPVAAPHATQLLHTQAAVLETISVLTLAFSVHPGFAYTLETKPDCGGPDPCWAWLNNHKPCFCGAQCSHPRPRPHKFHSGMSPALIQEYKDWAALPS